MRNRRILFREATAMASALGMAVVLMAALVAKAGPGPQQKPPASASQPSVAPQAQPQPAPAPQPVGTPEPPPVSKEEADAFQAFTQLQNQDGPQIISQGQAFLGKYALSTYRPVVYAKVVVAYLNAGQLEKLASTGQAALAEDPNNLPVLAMMAATLPRINPQGLDAAQRLDLAERCARRALQLGSAMTKPEGLQQEQFERARDEQLGMAHSGLGIVYYRRGDTAASVSELDLATKLDPAHDPIDFYLLGDGQMKLKKYPEAATAFDHCARAQWSSDWQERCRVAQAAAEKAAAGPPSRGAKP